MQTLKLKNLLNINIQADHGLQRTCSTANSENQMILLNRLNIRMLFTIIAGDMFIYIFLILFFLENRI